MTTYTRKPTQAQAFQYKRQAKKDWPQWVQDYEVSTAMGMQQIGAGAGVLLLPVKNGPTINVTDGDWLVLENGVLLVFRNDLFEAAFQADGAAEASDVNEAPAAPAETAPTETTPEIAPETADTGAKGRKKPAAGTPAAEDGQADA